MLRFKLLLTLVWQTSLALYVPYKMRVLKNHSHGKQHSISVHYFSNDLFSLFPPYFLSHFPPYFLFSQ